MHTQNLAVVLAALLPSGALAAPVAPPGQEPVARWQAISADERAGTRFTNTTPSNDRHAAEIAAEQYIGSAWPVFQPSKRQDDEDAENRRLKREQAIQEADERFNHADADADSAGRLNGQNGNDIDASSDRKVKRQNNYGDYVDIDCWVRRPYAHTSGNDIHVSGNDIEVKSDRRVKRQNNYGDFIHCWKKRQDDEEVEADRKVKRQNIYTDDIRCRMKRQNDYGDYVSCRMKRQDDEEAETERRVKRQDDEEGESERRAKRQDDEEGESERRVKRQDDEEAESARLMKRQDEEEAESERRVKRQDDEASDEGN
ncbi:hypothetical protein HIM_06635 [Hirsutella minnesotensis 3608]|uniref:Uncharacterized protein n=1 Tax=Hirsutella minnesotensis 3608 TaxID=1043627 RepID=A0A0F7ZZC2_9HYPO|nr:hypothetical protein HIM_06635 [Hirsutella minnesotensis 3608]